MRRVSSSNRVKGFRGHHRIDLWLGAEFAVGNDALQGGHVVAGDFEFEQEAVELGFGQRVGAFEFDRVLGGEHEERLRADRGFRRAR